MVTQRQIVAQFHVRPKGFSKVRTVLKTRSALVCR